MSCICFEPNADVSILNTGAHLKFISVCVNFVLYLTMCCWLYCVTLEPQVLPSFQIVYLVGLSSLCHAVYLNTEIENYSSELPRTLCCREIDWTRLLAFQYWKKRGSFTLFEKRKREISRLSQSGFTIQFVGLPSWTNVLFWSSILIR